MKLVKKLKAYKKCPRCGNRCLRQQETCEDCGLIFARLQYASNKAAKKKIRHFDKDFVIYTNQYPSDVSWWKVLLLSFLTGLVGGHYYYVGKYWKGALMSAGFVYLIFCTVFNQQMVDALSTNGAYLPIGILGLSWLVSIIYVAFKKFKVPVIVEVPEQEFKEKREEFLNSLPKNDQKTDKKIEKETETPEKDNSFKAESLDKSKKKRAMRKKEETLESKVEETEVKDVEVKK